MAAVRLSCPREGDVDEAAPPRQEAAEGHGKGPGTGQELVPQGAVCCCSAFQALCTVVGNACRLRGGEVPRRIPHRKEECHGTLRPTQPPAPQLSDGPHLIRLQ